ncbi:hypothetical protein RI367_008839, partial [Sorochytrium milnesiophthora]
MDQRPIDLQAFLGELILHRCENEETRAELALLKGHRALARKPAPDAEPHAPTPE